MKSLLLALAALSLLTAGCATPAYSGGLPTIKFPKERATGEASNRIVRNWAYESRQISDDINHALLLDPASHLTIWNVR